jgi:hypothetical protein
MISVIAGIPTRLPKLGVAGQVSYFLDGHFHGRPRAATASGCRFYLTGACDR